MEKDASGGVHVERSTKVRVRWRRRCSSFRNEQPNRDEGPTRIRNEVVEVEVVIEVMCSYFRAARGLDRKDSAERCPPLVSMVHR